MRSAKNGFTLIELLTVISIIAILAAIAIPQFSAYRQKAYGVEGYLLGSEVRKDIQEFYDHTGRFPKDNREAGLPDSRNLRGKFVEAVTVRNGVFDISFGQNFGRYKVLTARPAFLKNDPSAPVLWVWGDEKYPDAYNVAGENRTQEWKK
jgi:type IV pilus assembly protein PilA